nr:hypothetical protein [Tanacetum cinerariifolium]
MGARPHGEVGKGWGEGTGIGGKIGWINFAVPEYLGNGEWSSLAGLKLARENLESRIKKEDSITNVENAVFDLGFMDPLCFLFVDERVLIVPNIVKRDFKNFQTTQASLVGNAFASTHFNKYSTATSIYLFPREDENGPIVTRFDQVVGITVNCGPLETGVKHLLGSVVRAMMSPGRSIKASLENVNGFLAMNTPPDDLIHIDLEQEGFVP